MPATTPRFGLPYPLDSDPIHVANDFKKLADAIDADLYTVDLNNVNKAGDSMTGALHITAGGTSLTTVGSIAVGGQIAADLAVLGLPTGTANPLRLFGPKGANYISFYAEGNSTTRSAYVGFGHSNANFYVTNERTNGYLISSSENGHTWQTGATFAERMRLTETGDLLVAKTTAGALDAGSEMRAIGMFANWSTSAGTANAWFARLSGAAANDQPFVSFRNNTTQIGVIEMVGTTTVAYRTTSDYRLKDDLGPITDAVTRLLQLLPKRVRWKASGYEADGFLAHEVAMQVPQAVSGEKDAVTPNPPQIEVPILDEDGNPTGETEIIDDPMYPPGGQIQPQQLDQGQLMPIVVAALQDALSRIAALEAA